MRINSSAPRIILVVVLLIVAGFFLGFKAIPSGIADLWGKECLLAAVLPGYNLPTEPDGKLEESFLHTAGLPDNTRERGEDTVSASRAEYRNNNILVMEKEEVAASAIFTDVTVGIYCTHTTEGYLNENRSNGEPGEILQVAQSLKNAFEELGVPTAINTTVHDYPDWSAAYGNSLVSAKQLLKDHPSIQVLIDVHRDSSVAGVNTILEKDGISYAKMMLVVGSNQRLEHPNWEKNKGFAEEIAASLEARVPGITRGVRVQKARYNQHLTTGAILVEMGSTDNSVEQAQASARELAQVITDILIARNGE